MILDSTLKLEIVLTAAKTTNDMDVTVDYLDWNLQGEPTVPSFFRVASNGTTDVTILAAPTIVGTRREPQRITVYNKDTADKIALIKTDNGTTEFIEVRRTIPTLISLVWEKTTGWYTIGEIERI